MRGLDVCQACYHHLNLSWSSPAAFPAQPRQASPACVTVVRHGLLKLEIRDPHPEVGLMLLSLWTLPTWAVSPGPHCLSLHPISRGGKGDRRWERGLRHPRFTCSLVSETGGLSTYLEALLGMLRRSSEISSLGTGRGKCGWLVGCLLFTGN